jgi:hypothetical protein
MDVNSWNLTDVRIQLQTVPELAKIQAREWLSNIIDRLIAAYLYSSRHWALNRGGGTRQQLPEPWGLSTKTTPLFRECPDRFRQRVSGMAGHLFSKSAGKRGNGVCLPHLPLADQKIDRRGATVLLVGLRVAG